MKVIISSECQIGAHTYKIRVSEKALAVANLRGQVSYPEEVIRISLKHYDYERSNTMIFEALLHEILHVVDALYCGGELTEQQTESICAGMSQPLLSLGIEPDFSQIQEEEI